MEWINTKLLPEHIVVRSLEEDIFDGLILHHLFRKCQPSGLGPQPPILARPGPCGWASHPLNVMCGVPAVFGLLGLTKEPRSPVLGCTCCQRRQVSSEMPRASRGALGPHPGRRCLHLEMPSAPQGADPQPCPRLPSPLLLRCQVWSSHLPSTQSCEVPEGRGGPDSDPPPAWGLAQHWLVMKPCVVGYSMLPPAPSPAMEQVWLILRENPILFVSPVCRRGNRGLVTCSRSQSEEGGGVRI